MTNALDLLTDHAQRLQAAEGLDLQAAYQGACQHFFDHITADTPEDHIAVVTLFALSIGASDGDLQAVEGAPVIWSKADIGRYSGHGRGALVNALEHHPLRAALTTPTGLSFYLPHEAMAWADSLPRHKTFKKS